MLVKLIRHGVSEANERQRFCNRDDAAAPLTAAGQRQAEQLAAHLAQEAVTATVCSPLRRALETARAIAQPHGLAPVVMEGLREVSVGLFEGQSYHGQDAWRMTAYAAVERAWAEGWPEARLPGGESLTDVRDRFGAVLTELRGRYPANATVVAVGHGGLFRVGLPLVTSNLPLTGRLWPIEHGTVIELESTPAGWRCVRWGERDLDGTRV